ncbi:MAG TPA: Ni-sirohydrochlorin a,c-diamide reductive cyclase catalytic subunit, partial [Euryarchaeota archaeon]|nr:Ni-sirohydrochlorin a,c-diamide reductive cyclase catalytic subunit [Euryarchaeota archaeon]
MRTIIHPRPNPIVAAMYTLRDMDVDVIVEHGPAGCSFMASRPLEDADVRVVTSGMRDNDLVFGGEEPLINTLKQ